MFRKLKFLILLLTIAPAFLYAQTGKIVGKVTDLQTGDPLIGANVIVEGTLLGAATDANGDFMILNVPPGTYSIKARYIGYREQITSNIRVSVNLTTEVNFALPTEEYTTETIIVRAPKPLVEKNITNSTSVVNQEDIKNLPVRGVNAVVATQAGVVTQGGNIHIRGSRSDEVAYYVDGVLVNNPVFGGSATGVINNAIEEIQVQAGGYSAEFGGANGGIISTQTRTGTEKYQFAFEGITDNFAPFGEKFLDTYSRHYSELVLTAGGPVIPNNKKIRFFIAANNQFTRSPNAFYRGANFHNVFDPSRGATADTFDVVYPDGVLLNYNRNQYQIQGNISFNFQPFTLRLNGNFRMNTGRNGVGKTTYRAYNSATLREDQTISGSVKITHVINKNSFYDVIANYFNDYYVDMDPIFKHDITLYGDSIANAAVGRQLRGDGIQPINLSAFGFAFTPYDRVLSTYRKQRTESVGGKINFLYQIGKHHEFKTGAEFNYYTIRRYSFGRAFSLPSLARSIADGDIYDIYSRLDNYGYDVYGNKVDSGLEAPKHPTFAAYYIQDKMEFSDLVFNIGFRLDYIDIDAQIFENPSNVKFNRDGTIDQAQLLDVDPLLQISPRIGLSLPVTDRTVFHAQYGKFIQQSRLRDVYQGFNLLADNIKGGYAISAPVGFGLRPERTTSYEIGFRQQLGEYFAFDITGFYKDIKDQVQIRSIFAEEGANHRQYYAWVNGDFSTIKGIEIKLDLRRTERLSAQVDYTYSDARGTGSNPSSAFRSIWQSPTAEPFFPQQIAPLDFNQAHRGFINLDYRFTDDDGPEILGSKIFSNLGANILFSFNSGFNYTRWSGFFNERIPLEPLNASTTPWIFQLDARIDKTFKIGSLGFNVYLWVQNIFNTQNVVGVFNTSGDAYDDGWLTSVDGASIVEGYRINYGDQAAQMYSDLYKNLTYNAGNFGIPRVIRLGVRLNY